MNASAPPKGHDLYEALAVAWAIDSLEPADQALFEEHRHGCARCERTVLVTLEVAAELAYGVPDIDPPPQLRRRILAAATPRPPVQGTSPEIPPQHRQPQRWQPQHRQPQHRQSQDRQYVPDEDMGGPAGFAALDLFGDRGRTPGPRASEAPGDDERTRGDLGRQNTPEVAARKPSVGSRSPGHRRPRNARLGRRAKPARAGSRRRIVSVLAAAALVGISAVTTWEVTRPAAVTAPVAAPDRTATLSSPAGQGTIATVVVRAGTADVVTDALMPNAAGKQFYVWGVPAGGSGTPQVVGTFTVTSSGLHSYPVQLTKPLENYPVLAISEETAGSSPAKPNGVIARGALGR